VIVLFILYNLKPASGQEKSDNNFAAAPADAKRVRIAGAGAADLRALLAARLAPIFNMKNLPAGFRHILLPSSKNNVCDTQNTND
jgi:hypothetical protein